MYLDIANLVFFSGVINRLLFSLVFIRLFSFALLASDRFHCLIKFSQAFLSIVQRGLQDRILHFLFGAIHGLTHNCKPYTDEVGIPPHRVLRTIVQGFLHYRSQLSKTAGQALKFLRDRSLHVRFR